MGGDGLMQYSVLVSLNTLPYRPNSSRKRHILNEALEQIGSMTRYSSPCPINSFALLPNHLRTRRSRQQSSSHHPVSVKLKPHTSKEKTQPGGPANQRRRVSNPEVVSADDPHTPLSLFGPCPSVSCPPSFRITSTPDG